MKVGRVESNSGLFKSHKDLHSPLKVGGLQWRRFVSGGDCSHIKGEVDNVPDTPISLSLHRGVQARDTATKMSSSFNFH